MARKRSRWKRKGPPSKKKLQQKAALHRRQYNWERSELVHKAYCRAQLLNMPLFETCNEAFKREFDEDLPRSLYNYCAYDKKAAERREFHLREVLCDPAMTAVVNPAYAARTLARAIEVSLTPRLSRIETARVRRDGEWEDVVVEVQTIEPGTAIRGVAEMRNWMPYVHKILPEGAGPATIIGVGKAHQPKRLEGESRFGMARPMGDGPSGDAESFELPREMAEGIIAEENEEFAVPVERLTWMSSEDHEDLMRKWDQGVPPPHAGDRPTRRIMKDGTIEVFAADDDVPQSSEDVPGIIDEDMKQVIEAADNDVGEYEDD